MTLDALVRQYDELYVGGYGTGATTAHRMVMQAARLWKGRGVRSILDVGCGRGLLLEELGVWGFDVRGTEIVPILFERDLRRRPVVPCPIHKLTEQFDDERFDLVLFIDVLDHLRNEEEVLIALGAAEKLAIVGLIVTVNSPSRMCQINQERSWWKAMLAKEFTGELWESMKDSDAGTEFFGLWRGERESQ